jgi:hypothetical protein
MDLSHKGATEIFDLNKELLPFVHDPDTYSKEKYDAQLRETFYRKVSRSIRAGLTPSLSGDHSTDKLFVGEWLKQPPGTAIKL